MINEKSFKNKDLKRLYQGHPKARIDPQHQPRLKAYMTAMAASDDLSLIKSMAWTKAERYHKWSGNMKDGYVIHSVDIGGKNFRLLFRFDKETEYFFDVDYGPVH